ncbi:hypothetical protein CYMTET_51286 [Cymbomonas tetramitiformis]|uniref:Uncharacterized protein n=1 Tax=Cymbomonas tetramitiformis TaxID=36881 RepID=A0AAE0BMM3_9CHLO|nr:hypothetical protein CYMTET_51286 [Cymbomonas tetramitiformis]
MAAERPLCLLCGPQYALVAHPICRSVILWECRLTWKALKGGRMQSRGAEGGWRGAELQDTVMFDDDFDKPAAPAPVGQASHAAMQLALREGGAGWWMQLLREVGELMPEATAGVLAVTLSAQHKHLLEEGGAAWRDTVAALCGLLGVPRVCACHAPLAAAQLRSCLEGAPELGRELLQWALRQLGQVMGGLLREKAEPELQKQVTESCVDVLLLALSPDEAGGESVPGEGEEAEEPELHKLLDVEGRIQLGETLAVLVRLSPGSFVTHDRLSRQASRTLQDSLHLWEDPTAAPPLPSLERAETAVLLLGQVAVTSRAVETAALFHLVAHAARCAAHRALVGDVLTWVARSLGYTGRPQLLHQHVPQLAASWVMLRLPVAPRESAGPAASVHAQHPGDAGAPGAAHGALMDLRTLLAPSDLAAASQVVFAAEFAMSLIPALLQVFNKVPQDEGADHELRDALSYLARMHAQAPRKGRSAAAAGGGRGGMSDEDHEVKWLMADHLANVVAHLLPRDSGELQKPLVKEFFPDLNSMLSRCIHTVVRKMLLLAHGGPRGADIAARAAEDGEAAEDSGSHGEEPLPPPLLRPRQVVAALRKLAGAFRGVGKQEGEVIAEHILPPSKVWSHLAEIHSQLSHARHPAHKLHYLGAVDVLLELLHERLCAPPSTFCYLLHILQEALRSAPRGELQEECCRLLERVVDELLQGCSGPRGGVPEMEKLGEKLQPLLAMLMDCCSPVASGAQDAAQGEGGEGWRPPARASRLLEKLARMRTPACVRDFLQHLEPVPSACAELAEVVAIQQKLRQGMAVQHQLEGLAAHGAAMTHEQCARSAEALRLRLEPIRHRLLAALAEEAPTSAADVLHPHESWGKEDLLQRGWRLLQLGDGQAKLGPVRDLAGDLFTAVGGVASQEIGRVILRAAAGGGNSGSLPVSVSTGHAGARRGTPEYEEETMVAEIFQHLLQHLEDSDVRVIRAAEQGTRWVLQTAAGQAALRSRMQPTERQLLEVFSRGWPEATEERQKLEDAALLAAAECDRKRGGHRPALDDAAVWTPPRDGAHSGEDERWVSRVTHCLLCHVKSPAALRLCQQMTLLKASMAEALFPHVLAAVARGLPRGSLQGFSRLLEDHVLTPSNASRRATCLALRSLQALRIRYLRAVAANKAKPPPPRGEDVDPAADQWRHVYCLEVDYLVAAQAALRIGERFTALLLVEAWCEQRFGTLRLGPSLDMASAGHGLDDMPAHQQLLLEIYRGIDDPDVVYGVLLGADAASELCRREHEHQWPDVVESYDHQLRALAGGSGAGAAPRGEVRAGLVHALQHMGCLNTVAVYARSEFLGVGEGSLGGERGGSAGTSAELAPLLEVHQEAAWRMGQWDLQPPGYDGSSLSPCGFHSTVLVALQARPRGVLLLACCHPAWLALQPLDCFAAVGYGAPRHRSEGP